MAFVAPEAGAASASLLYMILALVAFLGYIVARGLIATWTHSIGFLLEWLAGELSFSVGKGFAKVDVNLGAPFREVDRLVLTALQNWAAGLEAETAYFFHGSATLAEWTIGQVSGLADDTADAFDWLIHTHLPRISAGKVATAGLAGLVAKMIADQLPKVLSHVTTVIHTVEHDVTHIVTKVVASAGTLAPPNPWAFPAFHRWWHDLTKWREVTQLRLSRLEKLLGVAGMAAVMANVLGLPNWRCLTRGNVGKTARALCLLSPKALEGLLGLIIDLLVIEDICTIINLMTRALGTVQPLITAFITDATTWACYGKSEHPPALNIPYPDTPPVTGLNFYVAA